MTPVWNDAERLGVFGVELARTLAKCPHRVHWVIADDGSGRAEQERLRSLHQRLGAIFPPISLHFSECHRGKGSVVREAWSLHDEADWLAFVDADGSLAPGELMRMFEKVAQAGKSVLAVRTNAEGTRVAASFARNAAHHLFVLAVKILLGIRCADPQCGAKVLHGGDYRLVAGLLQENGLAFDSELLAALACRQAEWLELPVTWIEKKGGKVRLFRDAWGMLAALSRIRKRRQAGEFSRG